VLGVDSFQILARVLEIIVHLQVKSELSAVAEIEAKPERGIRGDAAAVIDDLGLT
jgi:hypothetical protein